MIHRSLIGASVQLHTAKFYVLHNYEMKDEINCFVRFTIVKYESFYIIIGRNFLSRKGVSSRTKYLLSSSTRCIDQGQIIHLVLNDKN
jgi:hypothetical protein